MYSFIFRVDSGNIPELGTGHLYRCIKIYNYLLRKGINKKKLLFLIKSTGKFKTSQKILNHLKIQYKSLNEKIKDFSKEEILFLKKFNSKVIIFDRLSKINNFFLKKIKKNYGKIIAIDIIKKKEIKLDYFINPLNNNLTKKKKIKNYKNNILPSFGEIKKSYKKRKIIKKIFIFFGGYDHNKISNNIAKLSISNTKFIKPTSKKNFYKLMNSSDLVLCSGGLTVFDAIYMNKIIIAIPQYNHQLKNLKILQKNGLIFLSRLSGNFQKNIKNIIQKSLSLSYKHKLMIYCKQKKIIPKKSQIKILEKIYNV